MLICAARSNNVLICIKRHRSSTSRIHRQDRPRLLLSRSRVVLLKATLRVERLARQANINNLHNINSSISRRTCHQDSRSSNMVGIRRKSFCNCKLSSSTKRKWQGCKSNKSPLRNKPSKLSCANSKNGSTLHSFNNSKSSKNSIMPKQVLSSMAELAPKSSKGHRRMGSTNNQRMVRNTDHICKYSRFEK